MVAQQEMTLVQQEDVTVGYGQVPVVEVNRPSPIDLAKAINFLRSGCPAVQIVGYYIYTEFLLEEFRTSIKQLEFEEETFTVDLHSKDVIIVHRF